MCTIFPYTPETPVKIILCIINNKMAEGFLRFLEALTQTQEQLVLFESSEGSTKYPNVSIDGTLVGLQLY